MAITNAPVVAAINLCVHSIKYSSLGKIPFGHNGQSGQVNPSPAAEQTGEDIPITLDFIESKDFRTLAFNALPGEPGNNPTINAKVGDRIIFNISNVGKSFHSFGVTLNDEGFGGILSGTAVATANAPLKPGEGGFSEFIPGEPGTYYYICTVPGHREMGMVGTIIVE